MASLVCGRGFVAAPTRRNVGPGSAGRPGKLGSTGSAARLAARRQWAGASSLQGTAAASSQDEARPADQCLPVARRSLLGAVWLLAAMPGGGVARADENSNARIKWAGAEAAQLAEQAEDAFARKDLKLALKIYSQLIEMQPEEPSWYNGRAQVLTDLKQFKQAVADLDKAIALRPDGYLDFRLYADRALAHEGLYEWEPALKDYDVAIAAAEAANYTAPYLLNSRGNVHASLQQWEEARADYLGSARGFQLARALSPSLYAQGNAALVAVQLGADNAAAEKELRAVARRAPGSIDMRAALAALLWREGRQQEAEEAWEFACSRINSGQLVEGGPIIDGCAQYKDKDWLSRIRRWPPLLVEMFDDFINLRAPPEGTAVVSAGGEAGEPMNCRIAEVGVMTPCLQASLQRGSK